MIAETPPDSQHESADQEYSTQQLSEYYLEVEDLLERVENSLTHYQVLGLDSLTTAGEIKLAYLRAAALLNPSQFGLKLSIPDGLLLRVDEAFERISRAFAMLVSRSRRRQYDESLGQDRTAASPTPESISASLDRHQATSSSEGSRGPALPLDERDATNMNQPRPLPPVFSSPDGEHLEEDRRRCQRFKLSIPAVVTGYERDKDPWKEVTQTIDISRTGVLLRLAKPVRNGRVLHLTMPMPAELRAHGHGEPQYGIYAQVRRVEPLNNGRRVVGLELLGEDPPAGFLEKPSEVFDLNKWAGAQRRRAPREDRVEEVTIDYLSQTMELLGEEVTFTENVSSTGMRVMIEAAPADFELVRVRSSKRGFESLAAVSNQYVGNDRVERLCLRFLDNRWPLSLL